MSQETRINLECSKCKRSTYGTTKNKKTVKARLLLSKYCKYCQGHNDHKETK